MKIYIYRSNFEIVNKGPSRVSKSFFSAPNLAWMINDHLVANIAQYFNFLPSQRYLKGCTKFILTVCVVYNAVISDWLTLTKTFSINSTHSWRKNQPTQGSVQICLYWYSWQRLPKLWWNLFFQMMYKREYCSHKANTKWTEGWSTFYLQKTTDLTVFFFFAHTASENVDENLKEKGKQILIHSPATPCKSNCFHFFLIPF